MRRTWRHIHAERQSEEGAFLDIRPMGHISNINAYGVVILCLFNWDLRQCTGTDTQSKHIYAHSTETANGKHKHNAEHISADV